ncbi:head-tail connector protein [Phyllobacterium leguminum]|uniref:Putative phiE125 gp8 family phage protein n=1 Tax=Phyllobacterium leguminum TaxID=314237 RepID=A0A318T5K9_9HYPH|nr:phage head-tail connector protein [Phyllobacterium leguminum]PYE88386.1 putative phiE125 gp8 family phage protein [Phyllobacterium leguminum]
MTMHLITPPAVEPVTLADARAFLKISSTSEDALLSQLIRTAREVVEAQTGLALINQTWRLHLDRWPRSGRVALFRYPVREVVEVTAYAPDGTPVIIGANERHLHQGSRPQRLYLSQRSGSPSLGGLEIDFIAGFGETGADVPDALKHAILTLTAHFYEFRGAFDGEAQPVSFPPAFDRLVEIWRRVSL